MTPKEADERLWKIEYTSLINQYYYEILKRRWWGIERVVFTLSLLASVVDLGLLSVALFGQSSPSAELVGIGAGITAAVTLCLLLVIPVDSVYRQHDNLYRQWTELRGRCERLHLKLDASTAENVAPVYLDEIDELIRVQTEIQKEEGRANEGLLKYCQEEINKRTYAVSQGTYKEVMEKIGAD